MEFQHEGMEPGQASLGGFYLARRSTLPALPVEYIVETTAKCNLYCPMCPRETHAQPKADMTEGVFERLVRESGDTAEHMMLIGLGEPFMDPHIFERILNSVTATVYPASCRRTARFWMRLSRPACSIRRWNRLP